MKVYGDLEVALLEGFATIDLPLASANVRRIVFDTTESKVKVSNGITWKSASDLIPAFQYTVGSASGCDYPDLATALAAHSSNASFLLDNSYSAVEDVTISGNSISITGQGAVSSINGSLIISSGVTKSFIEKVKITGNVTFASASSLNYIVNCWVSASSAAVDNGVDNSFFALKG